MERIACLAFLTRSLLAVLFLAVTIETVPAGGFLSRLNTPGQAQRPPNSAPPELPVSRLPRVPGVDFA